MKLASPAVSAQACCALSPIAFFNRGLNWNSRGQQPFAVTVKWGGVLWRVLGAVAILVMFALLCGGSLHAQQDLEGTVPSNWAASTGTLSISPNHYKMGSQSLRWDWTGGDVITVSNPGITAASVLASGTNTCDFWVWNGTPIPGGKIHVAFMNGNVAQYWFDFYLNYSGAGWRRAVRSYPYDMGHVANASTTFTSVQISAPASGSGTFYLDAVTWTGGASRIQDAQNVDITTGNSGFYSMYNNVPDIATDTPTAAELSDLNTLRSRWLSAVKWVAPSAAQVTAAQNSFNAMNIVQDANGIRGQVVNDPTAIDGAGWTLTLARDYAWGTSTGTTSGNDMVLLAKHFLDQGFAANSNLVPGIWYSYVNIPPALVLAASAYDPATKAQLWDYFHWNFYTLGYFWSTNWTSNSDDVYCGINSIVGAILFLTPNDAEAVRQLKGLQRWLERWLVPGQGSGGVIQPDGLSFHHGGHYNGYMYAYNPLITTLSQLSGTGYQIDQPSYENFRTAIFTMLRMSADDTGGNSGYYANAICGRKTFGTTLFQGNVQLQQLGALGGAYYGQSADPVVARYYNRRFGTSGSYSYSLFTPYGVEDPPDGFYQYNYSPLGIYRRSNWVASMRAPEHYFWSSEMFGPTPNAQNAYGRYQSFGALEILYYGGIANSGEQINGWDWNQPPGTTTIALPASKLVALFPYYDEKIYSQNSFSGALAFHDGQSGLYAANFQENNDDANSNTTFVWRKSYFAFGSEIVCLGSNIADNDTTDPTVTTLFQGHLATQSTAITLDGNALTTFPYSSTASGANAHWLLDAYGTGYITQPGADINISRATQSSPDQSANGTTTTGDFAKVWLNHGMAPTGASYEYALFPGTNATAMASAASQHGNPATKPYQVIEQDSTAHVVEWNATGQIGYAVFATTALPAATQSAGLLNAVQRPCMVMTQPGTSNDAWMSVVDPDLNFQSDVSVARTFNLTLNGLWSLDNPPAGASVVSYVTGTTTIGVTTQHGFAVHLHLLPATNLPPAFSPTFITLPTATEGSAYSGSIASYGLDPYANDTLTFAKVSGPAWLSVAANGALSGTPGGGDSGVNNFTVSVTDGAGLSANGTLQISVVSNGTLSNASGGSWSTTSNWGSGLVASGTGETANFGTLNLTSDAIITLDGARPIGNLIFGDTTPSNNWTLATGTGGPLTLDVSSGSPTITVNNQTATLSVVIAGTKGLTKAGAGTLVLSGANTYTGGTIVTAGTVNVQNDQSAANGGWTISDSGFPAASGSPTLNVQTGSTVVVASGKSITLTTGDNSGQIMTINAAGTVTNNGNLSDGRQSAVNINSGGNWTQNGTMAIATSPTTFGTARMTINTGGTFTYTGSSPINMYPSGNSSGAAILTMAGGTFVTGQGFLNTSPNTGGTGFPTLTLSSGGTLRLTANIPTMAKISGATGLPFTFSLGTGGGIIDTNGYSTTITQSLSNVASQTGSLTKVGAGVLTLSGASTYTGATTINGGTLAVTGSLGTGAVTVASGGTLDGVGTLSGAVTVQAGGTLTAGGGGIGTLTINNTLSLAGSTQMGISKSGSTTVADCVTGMTSVVYGGTLTVTNLGGTPAAGDTFQLFSAGSYSGTFATLNLPALSPDLAWNTTALSTNGTIQVVVSKPTVATPATASPSTVTGTFTTLSVLGADPAGESGLTYTWSASGPGSVAFSANGTNAAKQTNATVGQSGAYTFTVTITNASGGTVTSSTSGSFSNLPNSAISTSIGSVGVAGGASYSNGAYTVSGSGADINGTADAFQFVSQPLSGDGEIRARVVSQTNTNALAKAGVMIRETTDAGSANAAMVITPGNGFSFQYRASTGGASTTVAGPALNPAPNNWVRLTRSGTLITAYVSADGNSWTQVGTAVISMASSVSAGLAVTSHDNTQTSTATFDNLTATPFPAPWQTVDIGAPGMQGSAEYFNSIFTVKGAGNVGGTADNFRFVYQTISGDGSITARVPAPGATGSGTRLGVMIRNDLTSGSTLAAMVTDGSGTCYWMRRVTTGGNGTRPASSSVTAPNIWLRVTRTGSGLFGYTSTDGVNWTKLDAYGITMGTNVYVGLVVASGSTTTLNTTVFDNVTVVP